MGRADYDKRANLATLFTSRSNFDRNFGFDRQFKPLSSEFQFSSSHVESLGSDQKIHKALIEF